MAEEMKYTAWVSDKYKLIYIPIAKNATRSFKHYLILSKKFGITKVLVNETDRNYKSFAFVRNPYSRVVSTYLNKIVKPHEKIIKLLLKPNGLRADMSFMDFIEFLCHDEKGQDFIDPHWTAQYRFLKDINLTFLGKLENFNSDFKKISILFNFPDIPIKHVNYTTLQGSHWVKQFGYIEKKDSKPEFDWTKLYNKKSAGLIYERYKADFLIFKYNKL